VDILFIVLYVFLAETLYSLRHNAAGFMPGGCMSGIQQGNSHNEAHLRGIRAFVLQKGHERIPPAITTVRSCNSANDKHQTFHEMAIHSQSM
jgi:hypothetical protein